MEGFNGPERLMIIRERDIFTKKTSQEVIEQNLLLLNKVNRQMNYLPKDFL